MDADQALRRQLIRLIEGVDAHMTFDEAVADFPTEAINLRAPNVSYTPWHLVEHLRITQRDILDYIRNRDYVELDWPADYWPAPDAVADRARFDASVDGFRADNRALREIVENPETDLFAVIPNTRGHTIVREVRIVGDHNAYHVGEFAVLRQVMGTWPPDRRE
jgi:hypothetical protein